MTRARLAPFVLASLALLAGCLALSSHDGGWPCDSDADCQSGERCAKWTGALRATCGEKTRCDDSVPCSGSEVCVADVCQPACTASDASRCGSFACNASSSSCFTHCSSEEQCASGRVCDGAFCRPPCIEGSCGDYACRSDGTCAHQCAAVADCAAGATCRSAACLPCTTQGGCGAAGSGGLSLGAGGGSGGVSGGGGGGAGMPGGSGGKGGAGGSAGHPNGGGAACDPVTQTGCHDPLKPRCTTSHDLSAPRPVACAALEGNVGDSGACSQTADGFGLDDCKPGYVCTRYGSTTWSYDSPTDFQCRAFCRDDAGCGPFAFCALYTPDGFGVCVPTCDPFVPCGPTVGSNPAPTCGEILEDNDGATFVLSCRSTGSYPEGVACVYDADCGADMICDPFAMCRKLCNDQHPCPAGTTCRDDAGPCSGPLVCECR